MVRNKEKEKELIIERNKKAKSKKQPEEPLPFLNPISQGQDGNWYLMKNSKLWLINLSMNHLDDSSREQIDKFLQLQSDSFCIVLTNNRFDDPKAKDRMRKKWGKRIAI